MFEVIKLIKLFIYINILKWFIYAWICVILLHFSLEHILFITYIYIYLCFIQNIYKSILWGRYFHAINPISALYKFLFRKIYRQKILDQINIRFIGTASPFQKKIWHSDRYPNIFFRTRLVLNMSLDAHNSAASTNSK